MGCTPHKTINQHTHTNSLSSGTAPELSRQEPEGYVYKLHRELDTCRIHSPPPQASNRPSVSSQYYKQVLLNFHRTSSFSHPQHQLPTLMSTHTHSTTIILNTADQSQPDSRSRDSIPTNKQTQSHICHRSAYKHPHRPYTRRNKSSTWATTQECKLPRSVDDLQRTVASHTASLPRVSYRLTHDST